MSISILKYYYSYGRFPIPPNLGKNSPIPPQYFHGLIPSSPIPPKKIFYEK